MATATSAFTSLPVPGIEDTMDMSSPARVQNEEDIDIDIDFAYNDHTLVDDDQMLDDDQVRPTTATDTAMDDDAGHDTTLIPEADMVDDLQAQEEDDDLIDYGDDDYLGDDTEHATIAGTLLQHADAPEDVDEEIGIQDRDGTLVGPDSVDKLVEVVSDEAAEPRHPSSQDRLAVTEDGRYLNIGEPDDLSAQQGSDEVDGVEDVNLSLHENETAEAEGRYHEHATHHGLDGTDEAVPTRISIDTLASGISEGPATPTDTGLHPMIIQIGDAQIPLFRSKHQADGLLTNDNLVGHHLADLISSCKEHWEERVGSTFSENQECTLRFEGLPLKLRESSKAAYNSTLNDVLKVYLHLHQNAGTESIPPLFLTLTTPQNFADVLQSLKLAAESGEGIPNIQYREVDEEEEEDQFVEEADAEDGNENHEQDAQHEEKSLQGEEADQIAKTDEDEGVDEGDIYDSENEQEDLDQEANYDIADEELEQFQDTIGHDEDSRDENIQSHESAQSASSTADTHHITDEKSRLQAAITGSHDELPPLANGQGQRRFSPASSAINGGRHQDIAAGEYGANTKKDWDQNLRPTGGHPNQEGEGTMPSAALEAMRPTEEAEDDAADLEPVPISPSRDGDEETGLSPHHSHEEGDSGVEVDDNESEPVDEETEAYQNGILHDQSDALNEQPDEDEPFSTAHSSLSTHAYEKGLHSTGEPEAADDDAQVNLIQSPILETFDDPNELIDFDDDTPAEHEARKGSPPGAQPASPGSPLGKRSYEEHAEDDLYDDSDEPELKKSRPD